MLRHQHQSPLSSIRTWGWTLQCGNSPGAVGVTGVARGPGQGWAPGALGKASFAFAERGYVSLQAVTFTLHIVSSQSLFESLILIN